jgi:hypothetical protein
MLVDGARHQLLAGAGFAVISTVASLSVTRPIIFWTARRASLDPTSASSSPSGAIGGEVSLRDRSMREIREMRSSRPIGFVKWSKAPSRIASMVFSALA